MLLSDLFELAPSSKTFGLSKHAYDKLSYKAQCAIDDWSSYNWTGGPLEQAVAENSDVAQDIERVFAPIRAQLPLLITLYRGIIIDPKYTTWQKGILQSWTSDVRTAELFAGLRYGKRWKSTLLIEPPSAMEVDQLVNKFAVTGFLKWHGNYYVRNKQHPEYYNIYDKHKGFITDGDDIRDDIVRRFDGNDEWNQKKIAKAKVFVEEISRDRVVWITNTLNCKEFIVRR